MAEFCLKCFNKINETHYTRLQVKRSKELDLCEGCGEYKRVVVRFQNLTPWSKLENGVRQKYLR